MSRSSVKYRISVLKEWNGSERQKNLWKSIKVYIYNYKPNK